jgi:hypothetical protein
LRDLKKPENQPKSTQNGLKWAKIGQKNGKLLIISTRSHNSRIGSTIHDNQKDQYMTNSTIEDRRNEIEGLKILINNLFDFWELSPAERVKLAETISSGDFERNCGLLLSIHKFLGLLFPDNQEIKKIWVKRKMADFGDRTPLDIMLDEGVEGIETIRKYCGGLVNA